MTIFSWIHKRELGIKPTLGDLEKVHKSVYSSLEAYSSWCNAAEESSEYGGVYNLEFSPDGSLLVGACEKRAIVIFDPITNHQTKAIRNAHQDCVNCVKFLDDRLFATCSDDTTIALWDTRNLNTKVRSLHGHMNWVKNIEYSRKDNLLVTSGFDGSIFTWDLNSYTEQGFIYRKVFHTSGLMRCRLTPDANKLVICTTGGYLIIVHNLDLTTLEKDLEGFRPNIYRLMQLGRQYIPYAGSYEHVFAKSMKKNRVELVSDFPVDNDAEVISSLQIHPQGWCALSRNISYDESSEWTCIHDIQDWALSDEDEDGNAAAKRKTKKKKSKSGHTRRTPRGARYVDPPEDSAAVTTVLTHPDIWAAEVTVRDRTLGHRRRNSTGTFGNTHVYGISSGVLVPMTPQESLLIPSEDQPEEELQSDDQLAQNSEEEQPRQPTSLSSIVSTTLANINAPPNYAGLIGCHVKQNTSRMLYYIEEPNKGKGFIKELCFSADGRVICSPYGSGFRLLAFTKDCTELPYSLKETEPAKELHVLKFRKCHPDIVVSTKFSPRHPLLATGCLGGKVAWHQPKI